MGTYRCGKCGRDWKDYSMLQLGTLFRDCPLCRERKDSPKWE